MKRWKKFLLILFACYICFFISLGILSLTSLPENIITNISFIFFISPIFIYFFVIKKIIKKENEEITNLSPKIQKLLQINKLYDFKEIKHNNHSIVEREYSRKSLDRVTAASIIKYHIENDIYFLRTDIENAIYDIELLGKYNKDIEEIIESEIINNSKYSIKKFKRIENRIFNCLVHKKEEFIITLKIEAYYRSNSGKVNESKRGKYSFEELIGFYNAWQNGRKYDETIKQERRIMNDDIRYNVLKRDNYTCQICGATAKDGAKLHVDHIIPVSRGGKTVMSNLQTLCERCNIGKSDKLNAENDNSMICPRCGSKLVNRKGKYGEFIGCSSYPKCRYKR